MKTTLDKILSLLDEKSISEITYGPIDSALLKVIPVSEQVKDHLSFNRLIASFIQNIRRPAGPSHPEEDSEAMEEALWFIRNYYSESCDDSYDIALADALDDESCGVEFVLERIGGKLKEIERQRYISWVITSHIDPSDWKLRVSLAEEIFRRFGRYLPPNIVCSNPALYACHLEYLFNLILSSESILRHSASSRF